MEEEGNTVFAPFFLFDLFLIDFPIERRKRGSRPFLPFLSAIPSLLPAVIGEAVTLLLPLSPSALFLFF